MQKKRMIYKKERQIELLCSGIYKNINYHIISYGLYPCAYIEIPVGHPLYEIEYYDLYEKCFDISVHGDFTYSQHSLLDLSTDKWIIGWDYAHCDDYICGLNNNSNLKKWTIEEIEKECQNVIEQIIKL